MVQLGTIYEMMAPNGHWAFRSGLQYSFSSKHIDGSDDEGFLFQVDNESQYEYLRVKSISQQSHYLGIPIEVRRYLLPPDKGFRLFVLAQANFDFLLDNKNSVEFCNEAMTPYAGEVVCHYDDPSTMLIHPYIGFGLRAGKKDKIGVCFSWMTHFGDIYGNRSLLDATSGIKSQIELHIPIK